MRVGCIAPLGALHYLLGTHYRGESMSNTEIRACPGFLEIFSEFIDGTLAAKKEAEVLAHLDCCEGCLRHLRAYRNGVSAFRSMDVRPFEPVEPDDFYARLEERLRRGESWGYLEPTPAGTFRRPDHWASLSATGLALTAIFAFIVFVTGVSIPDGESGRSASGRPPVSMAGVIPNVLSVGGLTGRVESEPEVTRAEAAARTVEEVSDPEARYRQLAMRTVSDRIDRRPVETLEAEFALLQWRLLQEAAWSGPPGGDWPRWPAAELMEAAIRLP